jgi:hypothetical protein
MFNPKPNDLTRLAVRRPVVYALASGVVAAVIAAASVANIGPNAARFAAAGAGVFVLVLNLFLWREGGPGWRWNERHQLGSQVEGHEPPRAA